MSLYADAVTQPTKVLNSLLKWLDKAQAHAESLDFDVHNLLGQRLAPDQYPLLNQVLFASDAAKFAAFRLAAAEPTKQEDTETTLAELRERVTATLAMTAELTEAQFEGAGDRIMTLGFLPEGKAVRAEDYLREFALPNFYFHITTAYAILRHNGVQLGKRDYIGGMTLQDA